MEYGHKLNLFFAPSLPNNSGDILRSATGLHETKTVTRRDPNRSECNEACRHEFTATRVFLAHDGAKNHRRRDKRDHVPWVGAYPICPVPEDTTKRETTHKRRHASYIIIGSALWCFLLCIIRGKSRGTRFDVAHDTATHKGKRVGICNRVHDERYKMGTPAGNHQNFPMSSIGGRELKSRLNATTLFGICRDHDNTKEG